MAKVLGRVVDLTDALGRCIARFPVTGVVSGLCMCVCVRVYVRSRRGEMGEGEGDIIREEKRGIDQGEQCVSFNHKRPNTRRSTRDTFTSMRTNPDETSLTSGSAILLVPSLR